MIHLSAGTNILSIKQVIKGQQACIILVIDWNVGWLIIPNSHFFQIFLTEINRMNRVKWSTFARLFRYCSHDTDQLINIRRSEHTCIIGSDVEQLSDVIILSDSQRINLDTSLLQFTGRQMQRFSVRGIFSFRLSSVCHYQRNLWKGNNSMFRFCEVLCRLQRSRPKVAPRQRHLNTDSWR